MVRPRRRINYSHVMNQVRKIRQLSSDLSNESRDLNNIINDIVYIWKGEASREFIGQGEMLEGDINSTSKKMSEIATRISDVAYDIKREDDRRLDAYYDWLERQSDYYD
ncbi:WXG100 family type VII secretion target [Vallitalea sp.]|uniref:WXG100 family type VII secretion target n=1 Tax=Vallitalea sp. TaxID=1882829 RepID=UPI0025E2F3BB|nr:hypothetical protein [Vallitalea sp.]MCT4686965.1 hypothetical protein [Vallitalea sp.]